METLRNEKIPKRGLGVLEDARRSLAQRLTGCVDIEQTYQCYPLSTAMGGKRIELASPHPDERIVYGRTYATSVNRNVFNVREPLNPLQALSLLSHVAYPTAHRVSMPSQHYKQTSRGRIVVQTTREDSFLYFFPFPESEQPDLEYPKLIYIPQIDPEGCLYVAYKLLRGEIRDDSGTMITGIRELAGLWPEIHKDAYADIKKQNEIAKKIKAGMFQLCTSDRISYLLGQRLVSNDQLLMFYSAASSEMTKMRLEEMKARVEIGRKRDFLRVSSVFPIHHGSREYADPDSLLTPGAAVGVFAVDMIDHIWNAILDSDNVEDLYLTPDSVDHGLVDMYLYAERSLFAAAHQVMTGGSETLIADMQAVSPVFVTALAAAKRDRGNLQPDENVIRSVLSTKQNMAVRREVIDAISQVPKETPYGQYLRAAQRFLDVSYLPMSKTLCTLVRHNAHIFNHRDPDRGRVGQVHDMRKYQELMGKFHASAGTTKRKQYYSTRFQKDGSWRS